MARLTQCSAGVIGLSTALLLQQARYTVTIVARDFPGPFETFDPVKKINYTSPWGGARTFPTHVTTIAPTVPTYTHTHHRC